jgi:hypothetical protein
MYVQHPQATEKRFNPLNAVYRNPFDDARPVEHDFFRVVGCDFAGVDNTSTGGSYQAIVAILYDGQTNNAYIVDVQRVRNITRGNLTQWVVAFLNKNMPDLTCVEEAASGGYISGFLLRTTPFNVKIVQAKQSKEERALGIIGMIESGKVHLPKRSTFGDELKAEIAEFPYYCRQMSYARAANNFLADQLKRPRLHGQIA